MADKTFPIIGNCEVCPETAVPLTKYKGRYYCNLCLTEKKEQEHDEGERKRRERVAADFGRWNIE